MNKYLVKNKDTGTNKHYLRFARQWANADIHGIIGLEEINIISKLDPTAGLLLKARVESLILSQTISKAIRNHFRIILAKRKDNDRS